MVEKTLLEQVFDDNGNHILRNKQTGAAVRAPYTSWTYLDGWVGCTDYFTGTGEAIMTPEEFCKIGAANYPVNG